MKWYKPLCLVFCIEEHFQCKYIVYTHIICVQETKNFIWCININSFEHYVKLTSSRKLSSSSSLPKLSKITLKQEVPFGLRLHDKSKVVLVGKSICNNIIISIHCKWQPIIDMYPVLRKLIFWHLTAAFYQSLEPSNIMSK